MLANQRRPVEEEEEDEEPQLSLVDRKRRQMQSFKRRGGIEISSNDNQTSKHNNEKNPSESSTSNSQEVLAETNGNDEFNKVVVEREKGESLLSIVKRMRKEDELDPELARKKKQEEEESRVLESALAASTQALVSARERAEDVRFRERIVREWVRRVQPEPAEVTKSILESKLILVDGQNVPPPISKFENMALPTKIVEWLIHEKNIVKPSPIQMQGMPVVLSGRDMIGVASTGSGKTLSFLIPAVVCCLEQERLEGRLQPSEGPFVLILGPSRELQRQTQQIAVEMCDFAFGKNRFSIALAIGGESKSHQLSLHRTKGSHIVVGTPGRVVDYLNSRQLSLAICSLLVLDEGDRMMDEGFDEEVKRIIGFFHQRPRQTVLFSATMPRRVVEFARDALVDAVVVNVGRAGAASSNITQHVEYIEKEERFTRILDSLDRTAPPVLVFCTKNGDVDDVHEYLLLKGLEVRGIHAGKSQQDRNQAVDDFKAGNADILVASDVAAKGLDFPKIEHVINFDMPNEIEQYVHRIGRTGRGGNKGVATTFIDVSQVKPTLMKDLFGILRDAKQRAPLFLVGGEVGKYEEPDDEGEVDATVTCTVCGGFGHRVTNCPKLAQLGKKNLTRDVVTGGDY